MTMAAKNGNLQVIQDFKKWGHVDVADVRHNNYGALQGAIKNRHWDVCRLFLEWGIVYHEILACEDAIAAAAVAQEDGCQEVWQFLDSIRPSEA